MAKTKIAGSIAPPTDNEPSFQEVLFEALFGKPSESREGSKKPMTPEERRAWEKEKIMAIVNKLAEGPRQVIRLRYGLGDGHMYTVEEVGRIFKVNKDKIRRIETQALGEMVRLALKPQLKVLKKGKRKRT